MSATLARRIKHLESLVDQVVTPEVFRESVLFGTPAPGAPAKVREKFEAEMNAAIQRGAFVIVLVPLRPALPTLQRRPAAQR